MFQQALSLPDGPIRRKNLTQIFNAFSTAATAAAMRVIDEIDEPYNSKVNTCFDWWCILFLWCVCICVRVVDEIDEPYKFKCSITLFSYHTVFYHTVFYHTSFLSLFLIPPPHA